MGDVGDDFRAFDAYKRERRDALGMDCPNCRKLRPRATPKILLPGQRCWCGHRDTRSPQLIVDWNNARPAGAMREVYPERKPKGTAS